MNEALLDEIHEYNALTHAYSNPAFILGGLVALIDGNAKTDLFSYAARIGLDERTLPELLSTVALLNRHDGGGEPAVQIVLRAIVPQLAEPATCARLLSEQSHYIATAGALRREMEALSRDVRLSTPDLPDDSLTDAYEVVEAVNSFRDTMVPHGLSQVDDLLGTLAHYYELARVATRHPLYASNYSLYVTPWPSAH